MKINKSKTALAFQDGVLRKPNVIEVSSGTKIVNGVDTREKCLMVTVEKKVPLDSLSSDDIIPEILSDNKTKTDIIVGPRIYPHGVCPTHAAHSTLGASPCSAHNLRHVEIMGGIQCGNHIGYQGVGTLGAIVRDPTDNTLVCLTNAHVSGVAFDPTAGFNWAPGSMGGDTLEANDPIKPYTGPNPPDYTNPTGANWTAAPPLSGSDQTTQINMFAPGGHFISSHSGNYIGPVKRTVPLRFNNNSSFIPNYVDASIFTIDPSNVSGSYPNQSITSPVPMDSQPLGVAANTLPLFDFNDIEDLNSSNICVKIGRTTGRTPLPGDPEYITGQEATITDVDIGITISYGTEAYGLSAIAAHGFNSWTASFIHLIKIKFNCPEGGGDSAYSNSGDSGSVVYIYHNCQWKVLGLHFAGSSSDSLSACEFSGYCCRMDYVFKELHIGENWTNDSYDIHDGGTISQDVQDSVVTVLPDVSASTGMWDGSIILSKDQWNYVTGSPNHDYMSITYGPRGETLYNTGANWYMNTAATHDEYQFPSNSLIYELSGDSYDDITFNDSVMAWPGTVPASGTPEAVVFDHSFYRYTFTTGGPLSAPGTSWKFHFDLIDTGNPNVGHNGWVYSVGVLGGNRPQAMTAAPELFWERNNPIGNVMLSHTAAVDVNSPHAIRWAFYDINDVFIVGHNAGIGPANITYPTSQFSNPAIAYGRYSCQSHGNKMGNIIRLSRC